MVSSFSKNLVATTLCLAAVGLNGCQEMADGVCNISGEKMPEDWVLNVPRKGLVYTNPHSRECTRNLLYNLSTIAPLAANCGQVVHFSPACAIKRKDYAGGIDYTLIDHTPLPGGVIDLYSMPVQKGKLLAVRGMDAESAPEGSDSFTTKRRMVEALIEVQHPDATVNQGRPLYLVYNMGHESTKEADEVYINLKRAPWESADTPETRSIVSLFEELDHVLEQKKKTAEGNDSSD